MSARVGSETVEVLDAPLVERDRYGGTVRDWDNATTTQVRWCSIQPMSGTEQNLDREFTATHVRLFAPYDAPVSASSRVRYDGRTFEVDGEPELWREATGAKSHLQATLKILKG